MRYLFEEAKGVFENDPDPVAELQQPACTMPAFSCDLKPLSRRYGEGMHMLCSFWILIVWERGEGGPPLLNYQAG